MDENIKAVLPEVIIVLVEESTKTISAELGVDAAKAEAVAEKIIKDFVRIFGGTNLYLPQLSSAKRRIRDKELYGEFNGYNFQYLAVKHNICEVHVRNSIKAEQNRQRKKHQTRLALELA